MSNSLKPTATAVGIFVATISKSYDFVNDRQERVQGTAHKAYLIEHDDAGRAIDLHQFKVPAPLLPGVLAVKPGTAVQVDCTGYAKQAGRQTLVEWSISRITDVETGSILVESSIAA